MLKNMNIRFFTYCTNEENEADICEITENQFVAISCMDGSKIDYQRHTVFDNGCSQICLTIEPAYYPDYLDLERV